MYFGTNCKPYRFSFSDDFSAHACAYYSGSLFVGVFTGVNAGTSKSKDLGCSFEIFTHTRKSLIFV